MSDKASENEEFIFEQIKSRYELENGRRAQLDNKAGNLVGWIGLVVSIVLAGGGILFTNADDGPKISIAEFYLLVGLLAGMIALLIFALIAFRVGSYDVVPEPRQLINIYGREKHNTTLRTVAATMTDAIEKNSKANDGKANKITISWSLFLASMILAAIFITLQAQKLVG